MKSLLFVLFSLLFSVSGFAQSLNSTVLFYDEIEQGVGLQTLRYIINDQYMRVDNGQDSDDFILFDVAKKTIYSVNHEDMTILRIDNHPWSTPQFDFKVRIEQGVLQGAPKIKGKTVYRYEVNAGELHCAQVALIKNVFPKAMAVLYQYQQILSGQQVATLKNTPKEYHTPCFLIDQVYHSGEYYKLGLPVRIQTSRGYDTFLKNYKTQAFKSHLFVIPPSYTTYTAAL